MSMATNYRATKPIQQFDPTSCWAATLEWWARAIGNRTVITQINLLNVYLRYWDSSNPDTNPNYGTVSRANLISIISDSRWRMDCETVAGIDFTCHYVNRKMKHGPLVVGYRKPGIGNHVVSVYGASNTHIACMDPDGAQFRGPLASHYQGSQVIVGIPR